MYLLYTVELFDIIHKCGLAAQTHDDTQVYLSSSVPDVSAAVENFQVCVEKIEEWLRASRLKMNSEKTHR